MTAQDTRTIDLAPNSIEAEEAVLGAILISADALYDVIGFLKPASFFLVRHGWIFEAMLALKERGDPVDYLTVVAELGLRGHLAEIGGAAYILSLINKTPSALNCEGYGRIVERMYLRRGLIDAASGIARLAHSDETEIDEIMTQSEQLVFNVTHRSRPTRTVSLKTLASSIYDATIYRSTGKDDERVYTYQKDVDRLIGGFHPGDLVYVGGRPGMGKSAYVTSILCENARHGVKGGMVTLEMGAEQIGMRIIAAESDIPYLSVLNGDLDANTDEFNRFTQAVDTVAAWDLPIDDTPRVTPTELKTILRRMVFEHGIKFAIVDYVQLMRGGSGFSNGDNRTAEISYISSELKLMARELEIVIIAPVQLSRALEQRSDKHPQLSDMRESGGLEQDADVVMFLYRESYYKPDKLSDGRTDVEIAKHRHGKTGRVEVIFLPRRMSFVDATRYTFDLNEHLDAPAPLLLDDLGGKPNGNGNGSRHDDDHDHVYRG